MTLMNNSIEMALLPLLLSTAVPSANPRNMRKIQADYIFQNSGFDTTMVDDGVTLTPAGLYFHPSKLCHHCTGFHMEDDIVILLCRLKCKAF